MEPDEKEKQNGVLTFRHECRRVMKVLVAAYLTFALYAHFHPV